MENQVTNQNQETKTKSVILTDAPEKFPVIPFSVFCIGFAGTLYGTMPAGMLSFCLSFFVCFSSASALYHRSTPSRLVCLLTGGVSLLGCCILGTRTLLFDFTASFSAFRDGCVVYDGYHPVATCVFLVITFVLATWFSAYSIAKLHGFEGSEAEWLESLKGTDGAAGPAGADGRNFSVLGYYDDYESLLEAFSEEEPQAGDAYGVGTEAPYDVYIYDGTGSAFVCRADRICGKAYSRQPSACKAFCQG